MDEILEINNPHDKGYKFLLSCENVFLELLDSFVDKGWVEKIDRKAVIRIDKSYVLQDFSEKESDIVYRLRIKDSEVIFYLLLEMQSTVDFQMPYRLLLYMVEIYRDILKNTTTDEASKKDYKLPVIVPMVVYNGEGNWSANRSFKEGLNGHEMFGRYVLDFEYVLIDVKRYSKDRLLELSNLIGTVFFFDRKQSVIDIISSLKAAVKILKKLDSGSYQLFKTWFKNIALRELKEDDRNEIKQIIEAYKDEEVENMVHGLEISFKEMYKDAREEGKVEGKAEGKVEGKAEGKAEGLVSIVKNMLENGMDISLIVKVTRLSEESVLRIKQSIENKSH